MVKPLDTLYGVGRPSGLERAGGWRRNAATAAGNPERFGHRRLALLVWPLLCALAVLLPFPPLAWAGPLFPVQHFTAEDGLAGAVVRGIERTPDGVMWFACWGRGISSSDGLNWESYGIEEGLPNLDVRDIRMDAQGRLWAGTTEGIVCRNGERWERVNTGLADADVSVFTICPLPDGRVWFGLADGHVLAFSPEPDRDPDALPAGAWETVLDMEDPGREKSTEALHVRPDGSILAGCRTRGILRWRAGAWIQEDGDADVLRVSDILETPEIGRAHV